ncbi:MAG: ABC transporter permease [Anaerolineae bacterium]
MLKIILIGLKDVRLAIRDRAALIMMLLAPFLLTLGLGAVTGRFSGGSTMGISHIAVILINQDGKQLGNALVELFQSQDLDELIDATVSEDATAAYRQVDDDQAVAAILVPAGFTESIIPPPGQAEPGSPVQIELYDNPTMPTSVGVVKSILDAFVSQVEAERVGNQVILAQLLDSGLIQAQDVGRVAQELGPSNPAAGSASITLNNITSGGKQVSFDVLALLSPGMALMFLMYTVSNGGRTLLAERDQGTLPRLLVSPTTAVEVLGGKMVGIYLTGTLQMLVLIGGTSMLFGVRWGDSDAVQALVLAAVFAAVGWGMFITAIARTPSQVSMVGTAVMLTFGILGGTFVNLDAMPTWFRYISKITPNAWGLEGFTTLALGGTLPDILTPILALLAMGLILFAIAVLLFNRRGLVER